MSYPRSILVRYQRHQKTGLLAAYSEDLKGLLVTARSFDELNEELPVVIEDLIQKRFGAEVHFKWREEEPVAPGFIAAVEQCATLELAA